MRSGIFASYAIADFLLRADDAGLKRYRRLSKNDFTSYIKTLRDYYAREQRWRDRLFWRRRIDSAARRVSSRSPLCASVSFMPVVRRVNRIAA